VDFKPSSRNQAVSSQGESSGNQLFENGLRQIAQGNALLSAHLAAGLRRLSASVAAPGGEVIQMDLANDGVVQKSFDGARRRRRRTVSSGLHGASCVDV